STRRRRIRRKLKFMPAELKLPELGENVEKGDVVRVLVKAGDVIKKDQPIVELETDKATIEVPSDVDGTVADVKVKPGDRVKVGQVILTVETGGGAAEPKKAEAASAKSESAPAPSKAATAPAPAPEGTQLYVVDVEPP